MPVRERKGLDVFNGIKKQDLSSPFDEKLEIFTRFTTVQCQLSRFLPSIDNLVRIL